MSGGLLRRVVFWGLALTICTATSGSAQVVELRRGSGGSPIAELEARRILARGGYSVVTRDTVIARGDTIRMDLVVLRSTVRIEGVVEGDLLAVESDLFTRPGARVSGRLVVLGGGLYGSSLAHVSTPPIDASYYAYRVEDRSGDGYLITTPEGGGARARLPGLYGLVIPMYERVNGLTIPWGIDLEPGTARWIPSGRARVRYRTIRERMDGELGLSWSWDRWSIGFSGGRTVRSNEAWIRHDLPNSLSSLLLSADQRNYYDARFVDGRVRVEHGVELIWSHAVIFAWERAASLDAHDPFSLFEDDEGFQPNPPIDEGDIASIEIGSGVTWRGSSDWSVALDIGLETASRDVAGDFSFTLVDATVRTRVLTFGEQSLLVRGRTRAPLSSNSPRQRWTAIGGLGTLPTLERLAQGGARMWWIQATYLFPMARPMGPFARVTPWLQYASGNAWTVQAARPATVHNVGAGISLGPLGVGVYGDTDGSVEVVVLLGGPSNGTGAGF